MGKIILISCASKKLPYKSKARNLYISPLFKYGLKYANSLNPSKIFILSAKYGLLNPDTKIEPYNETLNDMNEEKLKQWAEKVILDLKQESDLERDEFIFLAGNNYRKFLIPHIKNYKVPLKNLGIGRQLKYLKDNLNEKNFCHEIHTLVNNMKRFRFPFKDNEIPLNGVYILFEKGENAHGGDRIVRIGTHTGKDQLRPRLKQHFINENKDRSIFRKNIGRAILNKNNDSFIKQWEIDLTTRDNKNAFSSLIDFEKQKNTEGLITGYIQDNFSFVVFRIDDKDKRLKTESKIISTISRCKECKPSKNWLGNCSPKEKIRKSGLWLVNELYKEPLNKEDYLDLSKDITTFKN